MVEELAVVEIFQKPNSNLQASTLPDMLPIFADLSGAVLCP